MNRAIILTSLLLFTIQLIAQKDRYHFAASYLGLEGEIIQESNSFKSLNSQNQINNTDLPSTLTPRVLIGATHFWGHADFYISIPLSNLKISGNRHASISNQVFTGFRFLPIKSQADHFSPYLGIGFNSKNYQQEGANGNSPLYSNWQWYPEIGLSYRTKKNIVFEIGARYFEKNEYHTYISRDLINSTAVSPLSFSIALKKVVDLTSSYSSEGAQKFLKKMHQKASENNALSAFSIGVGYNALIPLDKTDFASRLPFFNDEIEGNLSPDIGVAYYLHQMDASLRLSFRPLKQKETSYHYTHQLNRNSFAIEAFKFLGDYHGFAPFIGPYVSYDFYRLRESDFGQELIHKTFEKFGYGVVFGWDIRQSNIDYLILRTNLRYTPDLNHKHQGLSFTASQLEFNFIQIVFYPERFKVYKRRNHDHIN